MKVIEMLAKGIKAVPMCKTGEWKNRYYLTIEGDKIVKKYIYDEREDFLYDYMDSLLYDSCHSCNCSRILRMGNYKNY